MVAFPLSRALQKSLAATLASVLIFASFTLPLSWAGADKPPEIYQTTLASGQTVYVQEIHSQPIVTIDTWVNTGSAQETAQNNGVSHFLEHLLFKGTNIHKAGEIDRILESRGATFNAATSDDFTHFYITTASPYFKEALDLHADMLLNATVPPEELGRERKVVQEEINRSLDSPGRKGFIALSKLLYGKHPYAMDTLGPKSNIQNIPREDILGYYHKWYQPENFKTVVTGDITSQQAVDMVNQAFSKAYAQQARPVAGEPELSPVEPLNQPKSAVLSDTNLSAVQLMMGFQAPGIENRQDNYALDIAALILGQGASSRLYQHLKEDKQLVNDVSTANSTYQQGGIFYAGGEVKPANRLAVKKGLLEEIERFKAEGPTPEELEKAKTQVIKQFAFLNESTSGVANSIGYNITIGNLSDYTDYVANIQKISAKQVQEAAQKYLQPQKAVLVEVIPAGTATGDLSKQATANIALLQQEAKVALKPVVQPGAKGNASSRTQPTETASASKPVVTKIALPHGATLLLKPSPATQTVAFAIFAKGGQLSEEKPGLSALTSRVLLKGTENRSAKEISEELESLGLSLGATSEEDYTQITGASVTTDLSKLLLITQDVLNHPTFPQAELEKERADMLEQLKTSRDEPSSLMFEKLTEALYPSHPYGAVGERLEASLPGISRDDITRYYSESFQPKNLVISVVGNFDPDEVKRAFQDMLNALPQAKAGSVDYPDVAPLREDVKVEAQKPEQAATWMAYGWLAPGISTSRDYITLKVINTLLGSGLSSRLFVDLREKQGLAYHVSSIYPSTLKNGRFVMYIGTDPRNRDKVLEGFNQEIQRLQSEPVSAEELEQVKSKLIGGFALAHESNANQAFYIGLYETLGVGYQFDTQYPGFIKQVTAKDIERVAQTILKAPKVTTIVAPKAVRSEASVHED